MEDLLKDNFSDMKDDMGKLMRQVLSEPDSRIIVDEYAPQFQDIAEL